MGRQVSTFVYCCLIFFLSILSVEAQTVPIGETLNSSSGNPGVIMGAPQINVTVVQGLSFGKFCTGRNGGTVSVSSTGTRSSTGDVYLIPSGPGSPAIFRVVPVKKNTTIATITVRTIVNLTNGRGNSMTLTINDFYPMYPFPLGAANSNNDVKIGGSIAVGPLASTPAGSYSGSFELVFNAQ